MLLSRSASESKQGAAAQPVKRGASSTVRGSRSAPEPNPTPSTPQAPKSETNTKTHQKVDGTTKKTPQTKSGTPNGSTSSSSNPSSSSNEVIIGNCYCCGTLVSYPVKPRKFRCSVCNTTNILHPMPPQDKELHSVTYKYIKKLVDWCLAAAAQGNQTTHQVFEPLADYLYRAFKSPQCLNSSFKINKSSKHLHHTTSNINLHEVRDSFLLLCSLPTKRPLYNALKGASEMARRVSISNDDPRQLLWIVILMEIPFLSRALYYKPNESNTQMIDVPEIRALSYEILKRCIGVLANCQSKKVYNYFASWYARESSNEFTDKIDLLNLYITFHLRKYIPSKNSRPSQHHASQNHTNHFHPSDNEYHESWQIKEEMDEQDGLTRSKSSKGSKIKLHQYGNDWHIKTAATVMGILVRANGLRSEAVPVNCFYNSLVDYVNVKMDFDAWQTNRKTKDEISSQENDVMGIGAVLEYINGTKNEKVQFYLCQFPFLISLGGKISILEYEARRQMERKAEEAFINSLDKRTVIDVYFRVRVRREYIVQDSLQCIKSNPNNLKKSLRVQFVNEPGIDAGGLRKEWFSLLSKEIFSPQTGMFYNIDQSNYLWFAIKPMERSEIYYLLGAILGLAIYNSTILELKFPLTIYKILLGQHKLDLHDYQQLFPETYKHLMDLKKFDADTLSSLELTFEVTYKDLFGKVYTTELMPRGSKTAVTPENCQLYIDKYTGFFMFDGIKDQLSALVSGFSKVIGGNQMSLLSANEIQLLICGSEDTEIDLEILKSVAKYVGWNGNRDAAQCSHIVTWFWEYFQDLDLHKRKKFLVFVTGSDRVPATGIQNLVFKIHLVSNSDSNRLPVAHTCFNELALYNYSSKDKLVAKLSAAVNESAGFGIK